MLVLDIDLTVINCPDVLFSLPPPAAMGRSISGAEHGTKLNLRGFVAGEFENSAGGGYAWHQSGGVNAGVMILEPNCHAVHIARGNLAYTSRTYTRLWTSTRLSQSFFSPDWTHISVLWNFQLHRIFHALEAQLENGVPAAETMDSWIPE